MSSVERYLRKHDVVIGIELRKSVFGLGVLALFFVRNAILYPHGYFLVIRLVYFGSFVRFSGAKLFIFLQFGQYISSPGFLGHSMGVDYLRTYLT